METKLSKLEKAAAAGKWRDALRIAARFSELGDHGAAIKRGHEAYENGRFYQQIGQDPERLKSEAIAALCDRYKLDPKTGEKIMTTTSLTGVEIAQVTASLTGGGYRRAASKAKAIEKLNAAIADRVGVAAPDILARVLSAADLGSVRTVLKNELGWDENDAPPKAARKAIAPVKKRQDTKPKTDAKSPRAGTKSRITYDLMRRKKGVTQKESHEAGGMNESLSDVAQRFGETYGFDVSRTPEGRSIRYALVAQAAN